jgi:dihydroorotate dehydrogenase electron transfer subunit
VSGFARATAPFARRLLRVSGVDPLGAYELLRVADDDAPEPAPGQFLMLAAAERWGGGADGRPYLPRAFSIARRRAGEAHFLLEDVGPGTHRLAELRAGDPLWALGPLGRGFSAPAAGKRPILVGGGAGIAPLAILQDTLQLEAAVLVGFKDATHAGGAELLRGARVATDDGSVGHRGPCTDLLAAELGRDREAVVYACGPPAMLEVVRAMCASLSVQAQLALETGMACGFGACFGCAVPLPDGGYLRACVDGPVVDATALERVPEALGAHL